MKYVAMPSFPPGECIPLAECVVLGRVLPAFVPGFPHEGCCHGERWCCSLLSSDRHVLSTNRHSLRMSFYLGLETTLGGRLSLLCT